MTWFSVQALGGSGLFSGSGPRVRSDLAIAHIRINDERWCFKCDIVWLMKDPEITNPRPRPIRIALWVGWLWFALVFFNPGTIKNIERNFIYWLPLTLLFSIPLVLVAKGSGSGRMALNLIIPIALLLVGYNLLGLLYVITPMTLILFPFMLCFVWFPLLVVLICINRQSAREWFHSGQTATPAVL